MPDDSFQQSAHATNIAFERVLMQATGLSRVQVRQRLQERTQESIRQQNAFSNAVRAVVAEDQKGQQHTTSIAANSFRSDPTNPRGGKGGGSVGGPTIDDVIIVFNGTAYYCALNGTVGNPV